MKTNTLFLGCTMALALAASGAAFAAESTTVPATTDPAAVRAEHRAATSNMTQEERAAFRAQKQAEMTDEQRAAMRASAGNTNKGGKGKGSKARDGSGAGKMGDGSGMGQGKGR